MRLLLAEDDLMLGETLRDALRAAGYVTDWVKDGEHALAALKDEPFDLAIIDVGLPRMNGIQVIEQSRRAGISIPLLILTARSASEDKVCGLDAGADDYLLKPFDLHELLARLRALLRRQQRAPALKTLTYAGITLEPDSHQAWFHGQAVPLARREFALLETMLARPGQVFTRQQLEQAVYGWDDDVGSNALEVHIHHLRKKFSNQLIRTVRGIGYLLSAEEES